MAIKRMRKQCVPGGLSPPPSPRLGTRLIQELCLQNDDLQEQLDSSQTVQPGIVEMKHGKQYTKEVRQLYYSLLSQNIPLNTSKSGSDGTTLNQRKIAGALVNGMVLGVHTVADGSANSALNAITEEFTKVGAELQVPTANITLKNVVASTSDGASTH